MPKSFGVVSSYNDANKNDGGLLACISELEVQVGATKEKIVILLKAVAAVQNLIDNSKGVAGLHLNGDVADWDSLLKDGKYEEWLADFSTAMLVLPDQPSSCGECENCYRSLPCPEEEKQCN